MYNGIPQSLVLEPLLFMVCVNDVSNFNTELLLHDGWVGMTMVYRYVRPWIITFMPYPPKTEQDISEAIAAQSMKSYIKFKFHQGFMYQSYKFLHWEYINTKIQSCNTKWFRHQTKHFPRYWPSVRETTGHRWIPVTKDSDAELWCFL